MVDTHTAQEADTRAPQHDQLRIGDLDQQAADAWEAVLDAAGSTAWWYNPDASTALIAWLHQLPDLEDSDVGLALLELSLMRNRGWHDETDSQLGKRIARHRSNINPRRRRLRTAGVIASAGRVRGGPHRTVLGPMATLVVEHVRTAKRRHRDQSEHMSDVPAVGTSDVPAVGTSDVPAVGTSSRSVSSPKRSTRQIFAVDSTCQDCGGPVTTNPETGAPNPRCKPCHQAHAAARAAPPARHAAPAHSRDCGCPACSRRLAIEELVE